MTTDTHHDPKAAGEVFADPEAVLNEPSENVTLLGANDIPTEVADALDAEAPDAGDKFRKWQLAKRVEGAIKNSHDTEEMRTSWRGRKDYGGQHDAIEELKAFERGEVRGMLLRGDPGRGKTHLAGRATVRMRDMGDPVYWIEVERMLTEMKATFDGEGEITLNRYRRRIEQAPVLVLDDLGAERPSDWVTEQLTAILNYRFNHRSSCQTLITTNLGLEELVAAFGKRATSRLYGLCKGHVVDVTGRDLRLEDVG